MRKLGGFFGEGPVDTTLAGGWCISGGVIVLEADIPICADWSW